MRRFSWYRIFALLGSTGLLLAAAAAQGRHTLPEVSSYALDKSRVTLPADLSGAQNVVILYFQPDQSEDALAWAEGLQSVRSSNPGLGSYIVPVYARENFLFRWWIDASIRSGAPASQDRHTTVPIFVDKLNFLRSVGVSSEKTPVVLLLDKSGNVEWKTQGKYETGRVADLQNALRTDAHAAMWSSRPASGTGTFDLRASRH